MLVKWYHCTNCDVCIHAFCNKKKNSDKSLSLYRGAHRSFFKGGKRRIHYLLHEIKPYSCNQDFAKGLEPKVKMILLKKCCDWAACWANWCNSRSVLLTGVWGQAPGLWAIFAISEKNNHFNVIWITFRTFFIPSEKTKLLRLRIYLKFLNYPALSGLFICGLHSNHV